MKTEQTFVTCDECMAIDASELRFAVNGRNFAIDLCATHRAIFDTLIQTYVTAGHPVRFNNHAIRKDAPKGKVQAETPITTKPKRARKSRAKAVEAPTIQTSEEMTNGR
jgi:hypothetical protein